MRGRWKLIAWLAMALVVARVQCLAACSSEACRPKVPPCHQHHDSHQHELLQCAPDAVTAQAEQHRGLDPAVNPFAAQAAPVRVPAAMPEVAAADSPPPPAAFFVFRI